MSKPQDFRFIYVLTRDIPYCAADKSTGGTASSEGTLHAGRVVYLQGPASSTEPVPAYAEGLGIVRVEPQALAQAS